MMTDRANAICLLEILKEYSDENHPLAMREIIQKMNVIYDLKPDRRTIYSAVALFGCNFSMVKILLKNAFTQFKIHTLQSSYSKNAVQLLLYFNLLDPM